MDCNGGESPISPQAFALPGQNRARPRGGDVVAWGADLRARWTCSIAAGRGIGASMMKERALRAIAECRHIATMTEEPGRITRRFLTPPMHDVHAHLSARMVSLGMSVHVDAAGDLRSVWRPEPAGNKRLVLGSHIDTVPDAGAFDGVLGVTLALEWVELAAEMQLPISIEVIAFSEEEGVRYGVPFLGSRAVAGSFDLETLALEDAENVRMDEAIRAFGLDP